MVTMPVQTDAAHTHETVMLEDNPPASAACKTKVIGPANEMMTAISPAFHADNDEACHAFLSRCVNAAPHNHLRRDSHLGTFSDTSKANRAVAGPLSQS